MDLRLFLGVPREERLQGAGRLPASCSGMSFMSSTTGAWSLHFCAAAEHVGSHRLIFIFLQSSEHKSISRKDATFDSLAMSKPGLLVVLGVSVDDRQT